MLVNLDFNVLNDIKIIPDFNPRYDNLMPSLLCGSPPPLFPGQHTVISINVVGFALQACAKTIERRSQGRVITFSKSAVLRL